MKTKQNIYFLNPSYTHQPRPSPPGAVLRVKLHVSDGETHVPGTATVIPSNLWYW